MGGGEKKRRHTAGEILASGKPGDPRILDLTEKLLHVIGGRLFA